MDEQNAIQKRRIILPNFSERILSFLTFAIYIITMLIFEIGYCNASNMVNIVNRNFNEITYNFSLCRLIMYIVILILVGTFRKRFVNDAIETLEINKYKKIFTYLYLFLGVLTIIVASIIVAKFPLLSRGMSIGMMAVLVGAIVAIYISNNILKNVIIITLNLGMIFSISTNFNHAIDEKKHFMTAFNIAFGNFDYVENPITDSGIEQLPQISKFSTINQFLEKKYEPNITNEVNKEDIPSTPAEYNCLGYLPAALGIFIGKTLGGSIIDIYIMGRIFNLVFYTFLITIALKLIPYKKNIFAVIFLMPMALILAATYSNDGYCIGTVAIFIAYCLKLKYEKETINIKDFGILIGLFLLMLTAKSMAYILVGCIALMLPIKATLKKNKKYLPIITIVSIISVIILILGVITVKNTHIKEDARAAGNISVSGQINSILHNPVLDIRVAANHIKNTFLNMNWYKMLHDDKFFTENCQVVLIPLMLFMLYVAITEDDYNFKISNKVVMIVTFLFVYGMTSLVLYLSFSPVGSLNIGGYQTRYIIPILPLLLFCLSSNNIIVKNKENRNFNITIISGIFVMLGIMQSILV